MDIYLPIAEVSVNAPLLVALGALVGFISGLFGIGGGALVAEQLTAQLGTDVPLLGQVPFDPKLREGGDSGDPLVLADPDAAASVQIRAIAERLGLRPRGLAGLSLGISPVRKDR